MANKYYNPQTNIFDLKKKRARSWDWYDDIWKTVGKCVFCELKNRYIIYEKNGVVLTANLFPYTDGHLLIIPRRHIEYAKEFSLLEWESVRAIMYVAKKVIRKAFKYKNIWFLYREGALGEAQKTVGHLHIQVIPYKKGLMKVNYQPISWAPGEVGDRLKEEVKYMDNKYEKYLMKYSKYKDPERRIVVNGVIQNSRDEVLLVKKKSPIENQWETPSGSIEGNESTKEALKREVKEETNINIKNAKFIGMDEEEVDVWFPEGFKTRWKLIFLHFEVKVKSGKLKAGDDAKVAKWVPQKNLKRYKLSKITLSLFKKLSLIKKYDYSFFGSTGKAPLSTS